MNKRKDAYEKFAGDFKNETEFEEELDSEDIDAKDVEVEHFEEETSVLKEE